MRLIHYTNLEGLYGILSTTKIRLSDVRYLNDTTEVKEGIARLENALQKVELSSIMSSQVKESLKLAKQELNEFKFFSDSETPFYVCSFSQSPDLLSQWRAYGSFAIEFCSDSLRMDNFEFRECVYDDDEKRQLAGQHAERLLKSIEIHRSKNCFDEKYFDAISDFTNLSVTFKNQGFTEEREIRCLEQIHDDSERIKFVRNGHILKPYIEKEFSYEAIKAIHIGPVSDPELVQNSIEILINQIRHHNIEHEVEIIRSKIPYRG